MRYRCGRGGRTRVCRSGPSPPPSESYACRPWSENLSENEGAGRRMVLRRPVRRAAVSCRREDGPATSTTTSKIVAHALFQVVPHVAGTTLASQTHTHAIRPALALRSDLRCPARKESGRPRSDGRFARASCGRRSESAPPDGVRGTVKFEGWCPSPRGGRRAAGEPAPAGRTGAGAEVRKPVAVQTCCSNSKASYRRPAMSSCVPTIRVCV